jgi:hypothetical protein
MTRGTSECGKRVWPRSGVISPATLALRMTDKTMPVTVRLQCTVLRTITARIGRQ